MLAVEPLESRDTLSVASPAVVLIGLGVSAADYVPMTEAMTSQQYDALGLNQYGVGPGHIAAVVSLPDPGPLSDAQLQQLLAKEIAAGVLPQPGPNLVLMAYTPGWNVTDAFAAKFSGYHSVMSYQGESIPYTVTLRQPYESIAATHEYDEATAGHEIADPVQWQSEVIGGINVSNYILPNGQPAFQPQQAVGDPWNLAPAPPPTPPTSTAPGAVTSAFAELAAIPLQEFRALAYGILASIDPRDFAAPAAAAQAELAANPLLPTPQGQEAAQLGAAALAAALAH